MTIKKEIKDTVVSIYVQYPEITQKEIGEQVGIGRDTVLKILLERGIVPRTYTGDRTMARRLRHFDFDFFDRENKITSYWAGFFMADRSVTFGNTGGATFVCYVDSRDAWHMQKFYDDINYKEPLKFRKDGYVGLELHYVGFRNQLPKWGIVPNKTHDFHEPSCLSAENMKHYIRGWIDGDGNVYRYGRRARIVVASGNKPSMDWMENSLRALGYSGHIGVRRANSFSDNWVLYIGGTKQVGEVCEILEVDTEFCMPRKWKNSRLD